MARDLRISHLDAVLKFCEDNNLEPEDISSKINKSLKDKLANNYRDLNYLPKESTLDDECI